MPAKNRQSVVRPLLSPASVAPCYPGVCAPRWYGRYLARPAAGRHVLLDLSGTGVFLGAWVERMGGSSLLWAAELSIDGFPMANLNFGPALDRGLTQPNPTGIVVSLNSSAQMYTIGWQFPLRYAKNLKLTTYIPDRATKIEGQVMVGG